MSDVIYGWVTSSILAPQQVVEYLCDIFLSLLDANKQSLKCRNKVVEISPGGSLGAGLAAEVFASMLPETAKSSVFFFKQQVGFECPYHL